MNIKVSGLPSISEQIHHNQKGQQYIRKSDRTLWRVTGISGDVVHIHCVNGWERLIQETMPLLEFESKMSPYEVRS